MARKQKPISFPGVYEDKGKIQIAVTMPDGSRKRKNIGLDYTPENVLKAARLAADRTILWGEARPFHERADEWLEMKRQEGKRKATLVKYRQILEQVLRPAFDGKDVGMMTAEEFRQAILAARDWTAVTAKRWNDTLIVVRGCLAHAGMPGKAELLKNRKHLYPEPDPLTGHEWQEMVSWLYRNTPLQYALAIHLLFVTGIRPGELVALTPDDVDLKTGTLSVNWTRNLGETTTPKNHQRRIVQLNSAAKAVLATALRHAQGPTLFHHPHLGKPFHEHRPIREEAWDRYFEHHGHVRYRSIYQARHTWATAAIMAGASVKWVSRMLGHHSVTITEKHYAKWIFGDADRIEVGKTEAMFSAEIQRGAVSPPQVLENKGNSGAGNESRTPR